MLPHCAGELADRAAMVMSATLTMDYDELQKEQKDRCIQMQLAPGAK